MSDAQGEFKVALKDRIRGAVTGNFAIIWLLTNWRVPVVALSPGYEKPGDRIQAIAELLPASANGWGWMLGYTLLFTAIYLIVVEILKHGHFHLAQCFRSRQDVKVALDARMSAEVAKYGKAVDSIAGSLVEVLRGSLDDIQISQAHAEEVLSRYRGNAGFIESKGTQEAIIRILKERNNKIKNALASIAEIYPESTGAISDRMAQARSALKSFKSEGFASIIKRKVLELWSRWTR